MTSQPAGAPLFLGIEGGATRTLALLVDARGEVLRRIETGPANLRLLGDAELIQRLRDVHKEATSPRAIGIGMAGARTEADCNRIRRAAARVWPGVPCFATNDLETALMAAAQEKSDAAATRVLVLSGTGSCCFARARNGRTAKLGGWGHILGDKGSGFEIGLRALKAIVYYHDRDGIWSKLGQRVLRKLQLNEPDDLIGWVQRAVKDEIAGLAVEVFSAWARRDEIASDILEGAAHGLAEDAVACARRLAQSRSRVQFVLAGGVLTRQPRFAKKVTRFLHKLWPNAVVTLLKRESVWGAVELAKRHFHPPGAAFRFERRATTATNTKHGTQGVEIPTLDSLKLSPTEQRNPRSMNFHKLSIAEAIELMLREDEKIPPAILKERKNIERAVKFIVQAFKQGGRLFYVGAGSSGRLGVLDASECPPTFRAPPELVQGIIAGGQRALWESVEGAEDDPVAGARAIRFRGVDHRDVVVGIAASGRTPFVWGAIREANRRDAKTVLLCFNPHLKTPRRLQPDLVIAPNVGPEILTGSTRLKCGTGTKLVLNILTTVAMARTGKVISNLMVDLNPGNAKLRDRAVRIVRELTGMDEIAAKEALEKSGWIVKKACERLGTSA
jgi:N-acetylmuramic acid 6-phosphate etherase